MKNIHILLVSFLLTGSFSCQKEEPGSVKETGSLHIEIGLSIRVHEVNSALKSTQQTEDFMVVIYHADSTEAMVFANALLMPDTIHLEPGDYFVEAHSNNNLPAAFENPYYHGASDIFTVNSNSQQSVLVTCALANTIVSVAYSNNITSSFTDYATTVASVLDSLVFTRDETRFGYFQTLPLDIAVELTYLNPDGSQGLKLLYGSIPDPLPNRHYEIMVDAAIDEGSASFQIILDTTGVLVEVIDVSDDPGSPPAGAVAPGSLIITEIMYDPSALSDTEGEWFEIYNTSDQTINLQNLILGRNDINRHTITDSINLAPGEYLVCARTDLSTDVTNQYVYGSDISLSNTGAVLYIFNAGTETDPGALIFAVNYGGAGFPNGTGTSISLSPDMLSASDAILGSSWCTSTSVYSTGDLGTPGLVNDSCQ